MPAGHPRPFARQVALALKIEPSGQIFGHTEGYTSAPKSNLLRIWQSLRSPKRRAPSRRPASRASAG